MAVEKSSHFTLRDRWHFSACGIKQAAVTDNVSVHCREEGCIGKYIPRGPRDFPRAGILHPEAREISRGRSPREISRAENFRNFSQNFKISKFKLKSSKSRGP